MNLSEAAQLIRSTARRMDAVCGETVFDEFGIVERAGERHNLCWYSGARRQEYIQAFGRDTALLREESLSRFSNRYEIGDFEFAQDGSGPQSEAFVVVGDELYLLCTNTLKSMAEIAANPRWLEAQSAFVEMSERFRSNPLRVDPATPRQHIPV